MGTSSAERRANADGFASRADSGALNAAGPQKGLCDASEVIDSESKNSGEGRADELHGKSVRGEPGDDDVPEPTRVDVRDEGRGADVDDECRAYPGEHHRNGEGEFQFPQNGPAAHPNPAARL